MAETHVIGRGYGRFESRARIAAGAPAAIRAIDCVPGKMSGDAGIIPRQVRIPEWAQD